LVHILNNTLSLLVTVDLVAAERHVPDWIEDDSRDEPHDSKDDEERVTQLLVTQILG